MIVVGALDLSLTSTGAAVISWGAGMVPDEYRTWKIVPPGKSRGHERIDVIHSAVMGMATACDLVVVEGPSYGSTGSGQHERGGLWWIVTRALWVNGIPCQVLAPKQIKVYATGTGNAGKDDVVREVTRRFDQFQGGNDEADALAAGAMVMDFLGHPLAPMPAVNRTAITRAEWCSGAIALRDRKLTPIGVEGK